MAFTMMDLTTNSFTCFSIGLIIGFLSTLYRFNFSNKFFRFIDFIAKCLNFVFPFANCKECKDTKVLFFPDVALPCHSFTNSLMSLRTIKCKFKRDCKYLHAGDKSSLKEVYLTLNEAIKSIDICMYLITIKWLTVFLKHLKEERGVQVRIITDSNGDDEYKINNQASDLKNAGIVVKTNQSVGSLMHNKFVIIDNKTVVLGSFNWTNNAILRNDEAIIITSQRNIVSAFVEKFHIMWKQMQLNSDK